MNGDRVLITGGAGFIGSNLANALVDRNDVVVVDDESLGTPEHLSADVDYRQRSVLEEELPTDVDVVFHLAARSSYPMHEADPADGAHVNVEGFVNVVDQARDDGCDTVVYASTSSPTTSRIPSLRTSTSTIRSRMRANSERRQGGNRRSTSNRESAGSVSCTGELTRDGAPVADCEDR